MSEPGGPPVVGIRGLGKTYGSVEALADLRLDVRRGEILGFLGPNGAGKTTTIRILLGLLRPSAGTAAVLGRDCWSESVEVRRRVGYLPGDVRLYDHLRGRQMLRMLAGLRSAPVSFEELGERLGLDLERRIKGYSKGMKQKLGLIQALMHDPELLVLDEPTSALDPLVQEEVYTLLRERRRRGATVFFSSHVLSEVEKICDRVAIIRRGRLMAVEAVEEVADLYLRRVRVRFVDPGVALPALEAAGLDVARQPDGELWFTVRGEIDPVLKLLASHTVASLTVEPLGLEDVFFELYRDEGGTV